jgi:hypothetical protein
MTVFVALVFLLFHIVQLYNHEWRDDSHNSSRKWCHNWVNFTATPPPNNLKFRSAYNLLSQDFTAR